MTGAKRQIPDMFTQEQYDTAQEDLISRLQTMCERENGTNNVEATSTPGTGGDGMDDIIERPVTSERETAFNEYVLFCRICKMSKYFPKKFKAGSERRLGEKIVVGVVEEKGEDMKANQPFIDCNLADFISSKGRFNLVRFFSLQQKCFPHIYKLVVCLALLRTNEVGCERFFSYAGYVSDPRRTSLDVRNYEDITMLKQNMQSIFINEPWVVRQYLNIEKNKLWNEKRTADDKRFFELEDEILADSLGVGVEQLAMQQADIDSEHDGEIVQETPEDIEENTKAVAEFHYDIGDDPNDDLSSEKKTAKDSISIDSSSLSSTSDNESNNSE